MEPGSELKWKPVEPRHDEKEVILGPIMLGVMGAGLLALCCVCFIAGYEVGNHGTVLPGLKGASAKDAGPSAAEILAQSKPAAAPVASASQPVAPSAPVTVAKVSTAATTPKEPSLPTADPPPAITAQPSAAMPKADTAVSSTQAPEVNPAVRPALAVTTQPSISWRVQIAAVEHTDDADVLVGALRKRGYTVSVHHDLTDNLLHVQVGPFNSRGDAESMRQRLLNDGYNAVIQY